MGGGMVPTDILCPAQVKTQFTIEEAQCWIRPGQYLLYPIDDLSRAAFKDRLVKLLFQCLREIGARLQRTEDRRRARQITFSLCDSRLCSECIHVVRRNIENLIKFSLRVGKTTKAHVGNRVLGEHGNVARVKPLSFVEVGFASLPLPSSPLEKSEGLRNATAVWQKRSRLLKVAHRGVVIS